MFDLRDMLTEDRIINLKSKNKFGALKELTEVIAMSDRVSDADEFYQAIVEREKIVSTGIGYGLAIPHAKVPCVADFVISVGIAKDGIEFDSFDKKPVHIIVMIGASEEQKDDYIKVLSKVTQILKEEENRASILNAEDSSDILKMFLK